MLKPRDIYGQVTALTTALIESGLCDAQNFPSMVTHPYNVTEIGVTNKDYSIFLKSITYSEMYQAVLEKKVFNIKMIDGALLTLLYRFSNDRLVAHRLSYFPAPDLIAFQNEPELYTEDELYVDILDRRIVTVPIRFDFDNDDSVCRPLEHPASHLTLGQYKNCRIPVSSALTPYQFISFITTNFYHSANIQSSLQEFKDKFDDNDRENWLVFKDVHEPIIDRVIWEQIQEKRGKIRKRKPKDGERNIFSGLLVCADCGHNLNYHFNQGNHDIKYFNCSNYRGNRGTCSSTHYIRVDFLEQVVLGEIKRLTKYAVHYEDQFLEAVMGSSQKSAEAEHKRKQKELAAAQARDNELDVLFERIYEDNLAGKLSDERFAKMSQRYEAEQAELAEKIKLLHHEIDKLSSNSVSTDLFLSTVRKYTRAKKLTPRMLNELINRIEVHQAEKINGEWVQRLTIHYNCIGALFIPDTEPLPVPNVTVNTRRGVYVTYEPAQNE